MSSSSIYSSTLQTITNTKLEELSKKRDDFEQQRQALLSRVEAEQDPLIRLATLADGCKKCFRISVQATLGSSPGRLGRVVLGSSTESKVEVDIANIDRFIEQARYDSSLKHKVCNEWSTGLLRHLHVQSLRFQYADLYAKLVTEWLASDQRAAKAEDQDVPMTEEFEEVPSVKKLESRTAWEKAVFELADVDEISLKRYLSSLFGEVDAERKEEFKSLKTLRGEVHKFEMELTRPGQFTQTTLSWVVEGLIVSDLLSNEKRDVLRDFARNPVILSEIADVLNMRLASLTLWSWGDEVPVEQRRRLRGGYTVFMHEDLLQAIFLHYLGVRWSVFLKSAFLKFRDAGNAWKSNSKDIVGIDRAQREYYMGSIPQTSESLQMARQNVHRETYFSFQLLDHNEQKFEIDEGEEEAEFANDNPDADDTNGSSKRRRQMQQPTQQATQQQAQQPMQQSAQHSMLMSSQMQMQQTMMRQAAGRPSDVRHPYAPSLQERRAANKAKNPIRAKQKLLHLLSAEVSINLFLHHELTCFRSVFDQLYSGMPHITIISVLKFLGVSKDWLRFFEKFLTAPLKFIDESTEPRRRQRGMPGSHALSDFFGEAILFCMDYSVNRVTDGALLHRLQDDFWFWSDSQEKAVKAWEAIEEFTSATGMKLNLNKTGSVRIVGESKQPGIDPRLPQGQVRWGFLVMDAQSGRFTIDQKMIENHIRELRSQLKSKSSSVFDWISAYNAYAVTFFSSNLGKAANSLGRTHVDEMLAAHQHVQESIFEGHSAIDFLKITIRDRFGVEDIPDGFLFFPVELGGLDLKSPFIHLMQIRESVRSNPQALLERYLKDEIAGYMRLKHSYELGDRSHTRYKTSKSEWRPTGDTSSFMSFEDYTKFREDQPLINGTYSLAEIYRTLLEEPAETSINATAEMLLALEQLNKTNGRRIHGRWFDMEPYWKWVAIMYGPEIVARFDGLNIVDARLLPVGMVSFFRERRIKWQE